MTQIQTATLDAGADMQPSDEQIVEAGYMHTVETDEPLFTFDRKRIDRNGSRTAICKQACSAAGQ
ncbi:hypothetical protein VSR69_36035 [Paraburkholderia phytofirmans]|jgi:hypothetical protein|uniref:hypothetical protein n=1 Tax=Paraburkholderia sp. BL9I2N2 TaxID=1938809 RepID=UPI00104F28A8|nr:hypothetical protein [Paraburkholderia sp. BL9I2N2]TCK88548.1 hypothetical protein B0G74_6779 [Paraburkholderia sp. BL9I2N2]